MTDPPDDLDDLLATRPGTPAPGLRDRLLRQTERRLARGRWLRLGARAAAVAAVFAAGGLAGWSARAARTPPGAPEQIVEVVPVVVPVLHPPADDDRGSPAPPPSASAAELRAELEDDPAAAAKFYRQAGDAFLRQEDYANATRCYRLYLARAGDAGLTLDRDDTWLLVSLKNAAYKEKLDATNNDG